MLFWLFNCRSTTISRPDGQTDRQTDSQTVSQTDRHGHVDYELKPERQVKSIERERKSGNTQSLQQLKQGLFPTVMSCEALSFV